MNDLSAYGLGSYESKAYLTLVHEGACTAQEVSKKSGVPYGKIYPVLDALEAKGFLTISGSKPKRFIAVEPQVIFAAVVQKKERAVQQLQQHSQQLIKELGTLAVRKSQEPIERIRIIEGYRNYLNLSVSLHDKAKKEWLTISRIPVYQPHLDAYACCVKRGVQVKVLTKITPANEKNIPFWKKTGVELRQLPELPARFSVMDDSGVIIRLSGEGKYLALWVQSHSFAKSSLHYFHYLWEQAKPL